MNLLTLVYVSRARLPSPSPDEADLWASSRLANRRMGVTGYLHREADRYAQMVEGPAEEVDGLYARILTDPRHDEIMLIARETAEARLFRDWDMAFGDDRKASFARFAQARGGRPRLLTAAPIGEILGFFRDMAHRLEMAHPGRGEVRPG